MDKFEKNLAAMRLTYFKYLFCVLVIGNISNTAKAQGGLCPDNLDFEQGNFTNWLCQAGTVSAPGNVNTVFLSPTAPIPGRHTIISKATAGVDPYGNFSEICPNGSGYSVKLGNSQTGAQAEGISYTFTIPANATTFSILFYYAVVFQDPSHNTWEQPRFRARLIDVATGTNLPCVTFDFVATSNLPGFLPSPIAANVWYKDWTPISLNLSSFAGRTIMLEFITSDCTRGGHFGYAYMDVSTFCNGVISGNKICPGDTAITITAPFGFQSYQWYSDASFSTLLSNTQTLYLNPLPTVGSVFPVIVTPYPTFGCTDTLYATITVGTRPAANAGPDLDICQNQQAQVGAPPNLIYAYEWTPAAQVSNPSIANPLAWTLTPNPEEFIVKTTDILTGCIAYDTTIISTSQVDTSITLNGKDNFCANEPFAALLSLNNSATAIQWFDNSTPIPGATAITYQPLTGGSYWAQLTQNGCTDSTRSIPITVHQLPQASFSANSDTGCITNNSFVFTNTSTISDNSPMTYVWKFSDGSVLQTTDATITFLNTGNYLVELITSTSLGCKDSTNRTVRVFPNGIPNFLWDSICVNRQVLFKNLSNEKGSPQVSYNWDFKNGGPGSLLKNPLPVTYTAPGMIDVILKMTAVGCETAPQSVSKTVLANAPVPGIRYHDITVPQGSSKFINVRGNVGYVYHWQPQTQLNSYFTRYTEFYANDDVRYLIDITDKHTCVTTDTLQMLILKKPGFYLPTAFTPNGDGLNDVVKPYLIGMKSLKSFSVYNRWGNLIFYSKKYGEGWDGKYKGVEQDAGVYVWVLEFITNDDKIVKEKGTVTIVR